jgi:hypothetical protein
MSRRSEERAGEEEWRAAADPDAQGKPPSIWRRIVPLIVVAIVCAAAYAAWRVLGPR